MDTDLRQPAGDPADRLFAWAESVFPDAARARRMVPVAAAGLVAAVVADNLLAPGISRGEAACWLLAAAPSGWVAFHASRHGLRWMRDQFVEAGMPECNAWAPRAVLAAVASFCVMAGCSLSVSAATFAATWVQSSMLASAVVAHEQARADGRGPAAAPDGPTSPFRGCGDGALHASEVTLRPADAGKTSVSALLSRDGCPTRAEFIGTFGKPHAAAFGSHPELLSSSVRIHPVTGLAANPVH